GLLGREACGRAKGRNNVHWATNERRRGLGESLRHSVTIRILEGDVLAFEVTEIAQSLTEGVPVERVVDNADARDLPRLLRACGHAAAAPPSSVRNSRRINLAIIRSPRRRLQGDSGAQRCRSPWRPSD